KHGLAEQGAVRNVAHQQLDDYLQLVGRLDKASGRRDLGGFADGTAELIVRLGVIQLDGTNLSKVVLVTSNEIVCCRLGELRFRHKKICLGKVGGGQIVAKKEGYNSGLS